ncbi:MAG: glycosyltransferase [Candidatus Hydrogenedentes bacterium]|nr:glycosyltransferase [Candidatus Hydrogenedentota bacterium]
MTSPHVLTFNFHEPYLCLMAKAGLRITVGLYEKPPYARAWQTKFRPIPPNIAFAEETIWRQDLRASKYDVVIAHNEMNAANIIDAQVPCILVCHNRRTFLETTVSGDQEQGKLAYEKLLARLREKFSFVFISESKRRDYGLDGAVIPPGIDADAYGGYTGDTKEVLRVGNAMRTRDLMFDVDFQEKVCADFPNRIVGEDGAMPNARPSRDFEDLLGCYRSLRCLLHVTREAFEDGYNLAMLEAMACGMPVVSLANATSPITDGTDGFTSRDPDVLRTRIRSLLEDRDLARTIGARGRETVASHFPMDAFVEKWRTTIEQAIERHNGRPTHRKQDLEVIPRLNVVLEYCSSPFSTARYFERALREDQNVLTTGARVPDALVRDWGFDGPPPVQHVHDFPREIDGPVSDVFASLPTGFDPSLYLWVDSGVDDIPPDLELVSIPRVAYVIDTHCAFDQRLAMTRRFNFTFLAQKSRLDDFVRAGVPNVAWMPLGCSPGLHNVGPMDRIYDVAFVGSIPNDPNDRRKRLLDAVRERFPNVVFGKYWPEEMARIYAQAKIVVNISAARDINMRVFEAMASGALLITDEADGLEDLFVDSKHLVVYRNDTDLLCRIEQYLADNAARERIATAGKSLVLREHTYRERARRITLMVMESIGALGGLIGESRFNRGGYYRSPRPELQAHVPLRAQRILDCGCGGGEFGLALKHRGAREVCGIEVVERAFTIAKQHLDHAIYGSIENMELPWDDAYFDCVVFGDVLEHLIEPAAALKKVARVLSRDGVIVMSIPNIRFWQTVMMHANGRWQYEDAGIMDRTHLRFFCAPDMAQLVHDAGLEVLKLQPLSMWPPKELPRDVRGCLRLGKLTLGPLDDAEYQDLLVYQYLVVAAKPGMDRLADARHALDNQDFQSAYQFAVEARDVNLRDQKRIMAKAMARMGELDKAAALYAEALSFAPDDVDVVAELGLVLVAAGKNVEAEQHLQRTLATDPEHDRALGGLGLIALSDGEWDLAMKWFIRALDARLDNAAVVLRLLDCAERTAAFEPTLTVVQRYVDSYPGNTDAGYRFAELLHAANRPLEAVERLETLLMLQPEHAQANALLARIREASP